MRNSAKRTECVGRPGLEPHGNEPESEKSAEKPTRAVAVAEPKPEDSPPPPTVGTIEGMLRTATLTDEAIAEIAEILTRAAARQAPDAAPESAPSRRGRR